MDEDILMNNFTVSLTQFEGPLDLMLHLISQKKLDLFDLKIDVLIDQYIAYLDAVENKLEIASEYLAELANLVEYKSKKCLPQDVIALEADGYQEDPKDALIRRILEYRQFKEVSQLLNERYEERLLQFSKPIEKQVMDTGNQENYNHLQADQSDLIKAMQRIMQRFTLAHPTQVRISKVEVSIEYRTSQLLLTMSTLKEPFTFEDLTQDCEDVHLLIVTFLSILEMTRQEQISFILKSDEIHFRKGRKYGIDA